MPASPTLWQEWSAAAGADPFLAVATALFAAAVLHTFLAPRIAAAAHRFAAGTPTARALHLLGEVELVFAAWAAVLLAAMALWPDKGWRVACAYLGSADYTAARSGGGVAGPTRYLEPLFVLVIMAMASSRPVLSAAGRMLGTVARRLGDGPLARWLTVLTLAPPLGSLITEPAAMTLAALLLSAQFEALAPSARLRYATLALLFVNVSIGGTLTHFAAPPVVMVAARWGWTTPRILAELGLGAMLAIVLSNLAVAWLFRREFRELALRPSRPAPVAEIAPAWVTLAHLALMACAVLMLVRHDAALLLAAFAAFLALTLATPRWHGPLRLRAPVLVAVFLASLVVHGGLQGWWISPLLARLDAGQLFGGSLLLTAFNDNAAVTFLAAQVPALSAGTEAARALQHAVLAGAVAGGGLTVIANAPNPAGLAILAGHFEGGVSPLRLALWALLPTAIAGACLMLL